MKVTVISLTVLFCTAIGDWAALTVRTLKGMPTETGLLLPGEVTFGTMRVRSPLICDCRLGKAMSAMPRVGTQGEP